MAEVAEEGNSKTGDLVRFVTPERGKLDFLFVITFLRLKPEDCEEQEMKKLQKFRKKLNNP